MALESDLKSCLIWETDRPNAKASRRSTYFRIFGEEWCLTLSYSHRVSFGNDCIVHMYSRKGKKMTEMGASVTCHVIVGELAFGSSELFTNRNSEQQILRFNISSEDFDNTSQRWIICCRISSIEPLSLQIDNETMLISNGVSSGTSDQSVQTCAEIPSNLQQLSDDFSRLLDEEITPDATVTCGSRTWRVHRAVLTARSDVFAGMFRSGMAESETGTIHVEDLEATVLDSLIRYVYSGRVSGENVPGLYESADKYALLGLRKVCSDWMAERLSVENCLGFLALADSHDDDYLKEASVSFVTKHFRRIERTVWTNFRKEHPFLAIEVLECFAPSMT